MIPAPEPTLESICQILTDLESLAYARFNSGIGDGGPDTDDTPPDTRRIYSRYRDDAKRFREARLAVYREMDRQRREWIRSKE